MSENFGLKIGLEGEKEFKKSLADINNSFKVLGSEMKLVDSQFDKNDKSTEALTARSDVLNKEIDSQKQKIETLRSALANAAESFGENDRRTQNWQIQLNNAQAALTGMERELNSNNTALEKADKGFDNAGDEAKDFSDSVKKAADTSEDADGKLSKLGDTAKKIGAALGAAAAAVGTACVAAGKKLWDMANDVGSAGDQIDKTSQKIGISAESYQKWGYVFERCGADVNNLQTGMKKLSTVITDAAGGSDSAAEKLSAVGAFHRGTERKVAGRAAEYGNHGSARHGGRRRTHRCRKRPPREIRCGYGGCPEHKRRGNRASEAGSRGLRNGYEQRSGCGFRCF